MPDHDAWDDDYRFLQESHDVEHRKEVELEKERYAPTIPRSEIVRRYQEYLETFADAAALPSQHFIRCLGCGASVRMDLEACPICATKLVDAA